MATTRISAEDIDLSPALGELDEAQRSKVVEQLTAADEKLSGLVDTLNERGGKNFATEGVVLESEFSGQSMIRILLEDEKGTVGFGAELRPRNFFGDPERPWAPGRPPMVMATDGWDVEGSVSVRFKTRVAGRPYTIQEQVVEIDEKRYESLDEAVEAFVAVCERLADLAVSREPTTKGWKPDAPESVGAPSIA
jgi:hypothetical protein